MIVIMKRNNILLFGLIFFLILAIYSLNFESENKASTVSKVNEVKKTVLLDPGHGGEDPGAVSDISGIKEKDISLKIALYLREILKKEDIEVLMTRE
jgi:N-acetylmuramoyl-L-alanine amidase